MKSQRSIPTALLLGLAILPALHAEEEPSPEIIGLQKAAADFVIAYNSKDAAAIAALFTENGEMTDTTGADITSGRAEIKARYDELFAGDDASSAAIEVASVRLVTPHVAIEDGSFHVDPPGDDAPVRSFTYTAVLVKNDSAIWQIASTRDLTEVTSPEAELSDLADDLKGDWTSQEDGMRMDFAFGWDDTGKFLIGEMLNTAADAEPLSTKSESGGTVPAKPSHGGLSTAVVAPQRAIGHLPKTAGCCAMKAAVPLVRPPVQTAT